jgi:hypothetical protein
MVRISRYILVLVTILALAVAIPRLYWKAFETPVRKPFIMYSCVKNDFMIQRSGEPVRWEDTRGNKYTREQYEESLPLFYMRQLMLSGTMKDTINNIPMDVHEINMARSFFSHNPTDMVTPDPGDYPLIESESGRANLEMPKDFFRITWRMEFIDCKSNKILEEKSRLFSAALYKKGFEFPAVKITGLPTTRKSCDEGYLVIDSKNQLFHLKMIKGNPYIWKVEVPDGLTFKHIACVDFKDKLYYAYLFDTKGDIYILTQEDYELVKFPVGNFDAENNEMKIFGDLFNYDVVITGNGFIRVVVLDKQYQKSREYNETWPVKEEMSAGKVFGFLFPGQVNLSNENSNYINFYTSLNKGFKWLILSCLLVIGHFLIIRRRGKIKRHLVDFGLIVVTGIFGFIAVNIFPNKFFG